MKKLKLVVLAIIACIAVTGCSCERQAKTYTVTFDSNGGSTVAAQTIKEGEKVEIPSDPTKEGYTFDGWYIDEDKYDFSKEVNKDLTLTAKWAEDGDACTKTCSTGYTLDTKTCSCVKNGSSKTETVKVTSATMNKTSLELTVGSTSELSVTIKPTNATNKTVTWKSSDAKVATVSNGKVTAIGAGTATITATVDGKTATTKVTVKAASTTSNETKEEKVSYTVTFNSDGGSSVSSATVESGKTVSKPSNPTKSGYTFVEWQLNGNAYDFSSKVTSNITLKAVWKSNAVSASDISLDKTEAELINGAKVTIKATVTPTNTTDDVVWTSSNSNVATVSDGVVTAKAVNDTTTVTITATVGSKKATATITVKPKFTYSIADTCPNDLSTGQQKCVTVYRNGSVYTSSLVTGLYNSSKTSKVASYNSTYDVVVTPSSSTLAKAAWIVTNGKSYAISQK